MLPSLLLLLMVFSPYLGHIGDFNVKASYPIALIVCFLLAIRQLMSGGMLRALLLSRSLLALYGFSSLVLFSYFLNLDGMAGGAASYVALLVYNLLIISLLCFYVASKPDGVDALMADRMVTTLLTVGLLLTLAVVVEYFYPNEMYRLFLPQRLIDKTRYAVWGTRGGMVARRYAATLGGPNLFGAMLILVIPAAVSSVINGRTFFMKILGSLCTAGVVVDLWLANSRGAMSGALVAVALYLFLRSRRVFMLLLVALSVAVAPTLAYVQRSYLYTQSFGAFVERGRFWLTASSLTLRDFPSMLFGIGPMNLAFFKKTGVSSAHNIFMSVFHSFGVVGIVMMVMVIVQLHRVMVGTISQKVTLGIKGEYAEIQYAAFVGVLVHSLSDDIFLMNSQFMTIYGICLAPLLAMEIRTRKRQLATGPAGGSA